MPSRFARSLAGLLMAAMAILAARPAQAGNAALLEAWKARRQELSQKIADHLASQQRLPQNGTVRYTARVRPDPAAPGGLLLAVDEVNVVPAGAPPGARVEGPAASQGQEERVRQILEQKARFFSQICHGADLVVESIRKPAPEKRQQQFNYTPEVHAGAKAQSQTELAHVQQQCRIHAHRKDRWYRSLLG